MVSASLRRMVPPMLRDLSREQVDLCLSSILAHIPTLMEDHAPIPQYTLRLMCEVIKTSPYAVHVITSRYGYQNSFLLSYCATKNKNDNED